jgi:hypothetical protein
MKSQNIKTRQQIAEDYGISTKTLCRKLHRANIDLEPGLVYPISLELIYSALGVPKCPKKT